MSKGFFSFTLIFLLFVQAGVANQPENHPVVSHILRRPIESSALRSVGYSRRRHILEIEFANGAVYRYYEIARSVYRELIMAESKARYYDFNIRRHYRSVRVKSRLTDQSQN
jgi:KTSC domain